MGRGMIPASESSTYNYTLSASFLNSPEVIVGIIGFQSRSSPYLMLSIKPLPIATLTSLSFLIRFYYLYTSWSIVSFNFLAEDRSDLASSYF